MPVYPDLMMRGTNRVRSIVGTYLEQHMPAYLDILRLQYAELNADTLPYPKQYLSNDPFDTDQHAYPVVGTYFTNTGNFNKVQLNSDGSSDFEVRYSATIFVTVKTPFAGYDGANMPQYVVPYRASTIKLRDDMMAALRASILNSPSFGTANDEYRLVSDYSSIREAFPEPMKMNQENGLWVCSGLMNIDIDSIETVVNPIIGTVDHFNVDVEPLPFD